MSSAFTFGTWNFRNRKYRFERNKFEIFWHNIFLVLLILGKTCQVLSTFSDKTILFAIKQILAGIPHGQSKWIAHIQNWLRFWKLIVFWNDGCLSVLCVWKTQMMLLWINTDSFAISRDKYSKREFNRIYSARTDTIYPSIASRIAHGEFSKIWKTRSAPKSYRIQRYSNKMKIYVLFRQSPGEMTVLDSEPQSLTVFQFCFRKTEPKFAFEKSLQRFPTALSRGGEPRTF